MRSRFLAKSLLLVALPTPLAKAAEVTHIPPWLRADASIAYDYSHLGGSLVEGEDEVGSRVWEDHLLNYSLVFSGGPGVAAFLELPHWASSRLAFPAANEMVYDPSTQSGTMLDTDPLAETPTVSGAGLGGVWFGIRGTPFSEAFESRGNLATWLAEVGFRTADQTNFWDTTDGERGAGPGGSAWRLRMAFSTVHEPADSYIEGTFIRQSPFLANLYDADGAVLVSDVELNPSNDVLVRVGTELKAYDNTASDAFFKVDLRLAFGYHSWQTVPSGLLLPSVLSATRSIAVTEGEYSTLSAGLGFYYRAFRYMQLNFMGDVAYVTPHQLEHTYPISSGEDTLQVTVGTELRIMVR